MRGALRRYLTELSYIQKKQQKGEVTSASYTPCSPPVERATGYVPGRGWPAHGAARAEDEAPCDRLP